MELLKTSTNMSNQFQSTALRDPINISIGDLRDKSTTNEIHPRYASKERISKERDYFGSYKIPSDTLKKRTNPTEEYIRKKEEELMKKKALLEQLEKNGGTYTSKSGPQKSTLNGNTEFVLQELSDLKDMDLNEEVTVKDDLIKVLDTHVSLLKRKSQEQVEQLSKSKEYKTKMLKNKRLYNNADLEEPDVDNQFLAANNSRIQTLKHVQTQHKPEYIPLEELERIKLEHEKELLDISDEYHGRKHTPEEERRRREEMRVKLERQRQLHQMIQRPGYNNDKPLELKDIAYIQKFGNYLKKKNDEYDKLGYEEEWNNTRIKSLNANGLVNRTDGLPGDLDIDDHKLYYYDISDQKKPSFERPLLMHPHTGKESSYKKTFRKEPGYEDTMGRMYKTNSDLNEFNNFNNTVYTNNLNNTIAKNKKKLTISTGNNYEDLNPKSIVNQSVQMEKDNQDSQLPSPFIKMIFNMMPKNFKGKTLKNRIGFEMKLNDEMVKELGFEDKKDFEEKLNKYKTEDDNFMSEEEFIQFLKCKGQQQDEDEEKRRNEIRDNQLYSLTGQNFYKYQHMLDQLGDNEEEFLPGMSTTTFDFLKNPSTKKRLKALQTFNNTQSKSTSNMLLHAKNKNYPVDKEDYILYRDRTRTNNKNARNNKLNRSFDSRQVRTNPHMNSDINMNHNYETENIPQNTYNNFNIYRYQKKSDINFTVPEPFNFLKNNYHEKKLSKMKEILEERQKNEDEVFKHTFHANSLNKKMFNQAGNLENITEKEKEKRDRRIELKKKEIIANMRPFSFYDKDFENFCIRKNQECIPPEFIPFKANPIKWRSQVKMYDGMMENDFTRKERNQRRAEELLAKAALPPRMEMHEKQKKLQLEEEKKVEKEKNKQDKEKRLFKAKKAPNFERLHEKFINILDKKKRAAHPTIPKPFTFHEPKKKADLCNYLDYENNPKAKNPKKNKSIEKIRKTMKKKPQFEPATTKSLTLLMETRRKELEMRKKREEDIIKEDEQRIKKQKDFNERVNGSIVMIENRKKWKELEDKKKESIETFAQQEKEKNKDYKQKLQEMNQRISNRPLMMEEVSKVRDVNAMKQTNA